MSSGDVIVWTKDIAFTVYMDTYAVRTGWSGGQGAKWVDSPYDELKATLSDGEVCGILLWGSNESRDQLISYTGDQVRYGYGVVCVGTWIISTTSYETHTLQSRLVPPLAPNSFVPGTKIYLSLRGLFTPQDEWTIAGDPRAPNTHTVGTIVQSPSAANDEYLTVGLSI